MPEGTAEGAVAAGGEAIPLPKLHEEVFTTLEAWKAEQTPELEEKLSGLSTKYKEAFLADQKARGEAEAKNRPPEKYDIKLPEGSGLDPESPKDVAAFAKANGLSNAAAQAVMERDNARFAAYAEASKTQQEKQMKEIQDGWVAEATKDKEIGGENLTKSAELARRVAEKFMSDRPQFLEELNKTGMGNHPELVRLLYRVGKSMNDDTLVVPGANVKKERSLEEIFYPKAPAAV